MKRIFNVNSLLLLALLLLSLSCQKSITETEYSSTFPVSGDWTITVSLGTDSYGPYFMKVYNTASSKDSIWIDDNKTFWQFKAKAKVDMKALTFSAANSENETYASSVSFTNGKVIGKDSIYFEAEFSDDLGNIYKFGGHRKVSYEEYNSH